LYSPYATEDCIEQLFANREALYLQQLAYEGLFSCILGDAQPGCFPVCTTLSVGAYHKHHQQ